MSTGYHELVTAQLPETLYGVEDHEETIERNSSKALNAT